MLSLYRIALGLYYAGIRLAAFFGGKPKRWVEGRRDWRASLSACQLTGKIVWVHCASVGEHEQARPLIEALTQADPSIRIVLTFFSPTGYEHRKNDPTAHAVFYLPQDSPGNARFFVETLRPDLVIFVKYEFWYFMLEAIHKAHVPLILISAHFRPEQFKGYRKAFFARIFPFYDHIFVQDEASRDLLQEEFGYEQVSLAGDTRYDQVARIAEEAAPLPSAIQRCIEGRRVVVCGSTWEADERLLAAAWRQMPREAGGRQVVWLVVPHEPGPDAERRFKRLFGPEAGVLSSTEESPVNSSSAVLLVNAVGLLSRLYACADACWVGGGFGSGIHNLLEVAVYGKGAAFGPNHRKFFEAGELLRAGLAWSCETPAEAAAALRQLLENDDLRASVAERAKAFVQQRRGATQEILHWLDMEQIIETES